MEWDLPAKQRPVLNTELSVGYEQGLQSLTPHGDQELLKCSVKAAVAAIRMLLLSFKWEMGN